MPFTTEGDGGISDEEGGIDPGGIGVGLEGYQFRREATGRQQHPEEVDAGAGRWVEMDPPGLPERQPMSDPHAEHRASGEDPDAVEDLVFGTE